MSIRELNVSLPPLLPYRENEELQSTQMHLPPKESNRRSTRIESQNLLQIPLSLQPTPRRHSSVKLGHRFNERHPAPKQERPSPYPPKRTTDFPTGEDEEESFEGQSDGLEEEDAKVPGVGRRERKERKPQRVVRIVERMEERRRRLTILQPRSSQANRR